MTEPFFAPRFAVRIAGLTLAADIAAQVTRLSVTTDLDVAGSFALVVRNPDNAVLDSALFDLGKEIEIHIGYGTALEPALLGEITAIEPSFPPDGPPTVVIKGADRSHRMRRQQPAPTSFADTSDSLIAAELALANGLVPVVDPTPAFAGRVSKTGSDFAFLKQRAKRHFFDVYVEWDRLHFQFPRPQTSALVLEWGRNLSAFAPRVSASVLAGLQVVRGYNQELAQTMVGIALAGDVDRNNLLEKLGSSAADLLASLTRQALLGDDADNPFSATELARALLAEVLDGLYEGTGTCIGRPGLRAGEYVTIEGVGKRFSGTYRARKVSHVIDEKGFWTSFDIARNAHTGLLPLLRRTLLHEPSPAAAEPYLGVIVATVEDNDELAAGQSPLGRVKVSYPGLSDDVVSNWAPCARPMAGDTTGFYALPEKGEQVLVAFAKGDLNRPYVLGGLWTVQAPPPVRNDGHNDLRVIVSRSGHSIVFDDTDGAGKVVVSDAGGSTITLDSKNGSVTIRAAQNLTIAAGGQISLEAAGGATKLVMTSDHVDVS
ncbi:phage baseplate assembly protein V [Dactylosporangium sp. NPDC049140]|uniref:phage baseplate assembly protein V n=1 Tax=Dactylosporangium sp. NPDC049140 TaxID=3155647 RepID=UPI0033DA570D